MEDTVRDGFSISISVAYYLIVTQAVKVYTCHIVDKDWLLKSVEAKKQLPEDDYLFDSKKKDDKNTSVDDQKDTKKKSAKEEKSSKKRTLEETLNDDNEHLDKKQKDGQKATSKDLKVDVDEACFLKRESDDLSQQEWRLLIAFSQPPCVH